MNNNIKSATTAGLLGIFLGAFGAHNWYLGEKGKGIIHVALTGGGILFYIIADVILPLALSWRALSLVGWLILIMNFAAFAAIMGSWTWGFTEGITILVRGDLWLMRRGYTVANPNMQYQQPMQNNNGYDGYNGNMQNGNGYSGYNGGMQNGGFNNAPQGNMNNGQQMNAGMNNNMPVMQGGGKNAE